MFKLHKKNHEVHAQEHLASQKELEYFEFFFFRYNRLSDKFPAASISGCPNLSEAGFDLLNKLLTYDPAKVKLILFNGTRDYTNLALSIFYASLSFILLTKDT